MALPKHCTLAGICLLCLALVGCPHEQAKREGEVVPPPEGDAALAPPTLAGQVFYVYADVELPPDKAEADAKTDAKADAPPKPKIPQHHFSPSGWLGDYEAAIDLATNCTTQPHSGNTCIKVAYSAEGEVGWASGYWLHPKGNWGERAGHDLKSALRLTFWARGEKGGEVVSFKMGGVPGAKRDTAEVGTEKLTLSADWTKFVIDLRGADLSNVVGGFAFTITRADNPKGGTFYLDEIRYELRG